jgi:hypothetical protein
MGVYNREMKRSLLSRSRRPICLRLVHRVVCMSHNSEKDSRAGGTTSTWSFTESGQSYEATFEAVAHGHAILERNSGFIAVYHPDGVHSLLMTLYTRDGNQPRLRAKGFGENPASITFVFQDITNWKKSTEPSMASSCFLKIVIA